MNLSHLERLLGFLDGGGVAGIGIDVTSLVLAGKVLRQGWFAWEGMVNQGVAEGVVSEEGGKEWEWEDTTGGGIIVESDGNVRG